MPRPGTVVEVDGKTPPVLLHFGEGFRMEKLPRGSRIVYPPEPLPALRDPDGAIAHALDNPVDADPLRARMRPGMKLTIAFDDISLPLPPMRTPDIRQRVIEQVLDVAAAAGVDDVELIAATSLHRRMTPSELRRAVGERVFRAFHPHGLLRNHDAEDPEDRAYLGTTEEGEDVEISKRAAESDLLVYVNINLVAMDGGHKSVPVGLGTYRSIRHHHNVRTMVSSHSFMDPERSHLHHSSARMGRVVNEHVDVFHVETTLDNKSFPDEFGFLLKREREWSVADQLQFVASKRALEKLPAQARRTVFQRIVAPHAPTGVQAGATDAVHERTLEAVHRQQLVHVEGQADVLLTGLPYICPYNVNSIMNPILVACLGLGYFFNLYRGKPLVRRGGVMILEHPTPCEFHPGHHPSYVDFFEEVLAESTDPLQLEAKFEEEYAMDPWYRHLYRTGYAYHGVHPFYMWYWCAHALDYLGDVIVVGGDPRSVRRLGFRPASSLRDALEIAEQTVGRDPSLTYFHIPPIALADVS